jgi:hypothetical protein
VPVEIAMNVERGAATYWAQSDRAALYHRHCMNYMKPAGPTRPISAEEAAVLRRALEACPVVQISETLRESVSILRVVRRCACGRDTVDFDSIAGPRGQIVADGIGFTPDGQEIGLIVFARGDQLSSLEVYSSGNDAPARLPTVDSIRDCGQTKNG